MDARSQVMVLMTLLAFCVPITVLMHQTRSSQSERYSAETTSAEERARLTGDTTICALISDADERNWCVDNAIYQWARNFSGNDCRSVMVPEKQDQCFWYVATHLRRSALCSNIYKGDLKRRCHFAFQPEEPFAAGGVGHWLSVAIFLAAAFIFIFALLRLARPMERHFAKAIGSTYGALLGAVAQGMAEQSPFDLATYHVTLLQRIAYPPGTEFAWIDVRYLFAHFLLVPILYGCIGFLAAVAYNVVQRHVNKV